MREFAAPWAGRIADALGVAPERVVVEQPPRPDLGDLAFPMFPFAKAMKKSPGLIAADVAARLGPGASAEGPYVNVRLDRGSTAAAVVAAVLDGTPGRPGTLAGRRIMVEFSSPNTNKPLHLGHLRNDVLGESVSRLLAAAGAEVRKVCVINDRGIHICKSMLAYKETGAGATPESAAVKSDHFVGDFYVRFQKMTEQDPGAESRARELLRLWEAGDPETRALWKMMNDWAITGVRETYARTGVGFDQFYFESQIYLLGKDEVMKGLDTGVFFRADDGSVQADLTAENLDTKVLLRRDGTSIYIVQDIGLAISRARDWPFDQLIYVVGSEQRRHFQVLFALLRRLGFAWAESLYHLSYGMVNLPDGRMKSREGTVVDGDDLIDQLRDMALEEIREKEREEALGPGMSAAAAAERVALGALHYYLLQTSPSKDMLFNPRESLSFTGNTGPYLQYMGARISSLLKRAAASGAGGAAEDAGGADLTLLTGDAEWELVKALAGYDDAVAQAAAACDPSHLCAWLYGLSKAFSRFYHDCPILGADNPALTAARLALCRAALRALRDALGLVCIPFLEAM